MLWQEETGMSAFKLSAEAIRVCYGGGIGAGMLIHILHSYHVTIGDLTAMCGSFENLGLKVLHTFNFQHTVSLHMGNTSAATVRIICFFGTLDHVTWTVRLSF